MPMNWKGSLARRAYDQIGRIAFRGYDQTAGAWERPDVRNNDSVDYTASPWWVLRWLLPRAHVRPGDVLVEYGCGKGRVLLDAARRYPFARVVGVELDPTLAAAATHLLRRFGPFDHLDVTVADAAAWPLPDDATHVYLYNPFGGETFAAALGHIVASLDRAPRPLRLLYLNPVEHDAIAATGRFRQVSHKRARLGVDQTATVYEAT